MSEIFRSVHSSKTKNTSKIPLDQYYTSYEDMQYCVNKTLDILFDLGYSISEILEPSAGEGVFSDYLLINGFNVLAMDIEPKNKDVLKQDYLTCDVKYKKNRLIIGNPPYGARLNLAQKFFKKSIQIGDYVSFILPISQLDNTSFMYEFNLVHSEDLGKLTFTNDKKVHCCLNIYIRPKNGLNKKTSYSLKDITIIRQDNKNYKNIKEDIRMCYWGDGTAGKILSPKEHYSGEYKIIINNKELKQDIINFFNTVNRQQELNSTAMKRIKQYHIIKTIKKYIPNIK